MIKARLRSSGIKHPSNVCTLLGMSRIIAFIVFRRSQAQQSALIFSGKSGAYIQVVLANMQKVLKFAICSARLRCPCFTIAWPAQASSTKEGGP